MLDPSKAEGAASAWDECRGVLAEAHRVLRPGVELAVFDGDYATATVAIRANDPLQACVEHAIATLVHDPWLVRRLTALIRSAGIPSRRLISASLTPSARSSQIAS
jgi:hypothetical protein